MNRTILPLSAAAAFLLTTTTFAAAQSNATDTKALAAQVKVLSAETKSLKREVKQLRKTSENKTSAAKKTANASNDDNNPFGHYVTVTTSPFLGKESAFDASDLLYEQPSMNEDLKLLLQKQELMNKMAENGQSIDRPIIQLSGGIEGELYSTSGFGTSFTDNVALSTAELDMNAIASSWASAFMSLDYDSTPMSSGNREPKSTIFLKRGFATLGNLNVSPFYGSIGLMYVPFGRYSNGLLSAPLTLSIGRIRTEAALLGFHLDSGWFGSLYGFSGNQTSGTGSDLFKQGGANVGLERAFTDGDTQGKYSIGAGWVSNIADAQGEQNNGVSTSGGKFGGFGVAQTAAPSVSNNDIVHRVDGLDAHGKVTYGPVTAIAEYIGALTPYASTDLSFNSKKAEPKAMYAEMDYVLPFCKKMDPTIGIGYSQTWESLALNLPRNSYIAFASASFLKDTVEEIEYRHDVDYASTAIASGRGATTNITGSGKTRNSVIGQVGVYF